MDKLKKYLLYAISVLLMVVLIGCQTVSTDDKAKTDEPSTTKYQVEAISTETASRTIEDGGTGPYKAIMVGDSTLATHTIFRPADMNAFGEDNKLPILTWGNGGCANSCNGHTNFLSEIASHGFLVIAIGPMPQDGGMGGGGMMGRGGGAGAIGGGGMMSSTTSSQLLDAVDWAIAQEANETSIYYNKIDTEKVAVAGMSCGGLQAYEVSNDPRIDTTMICNSGLFGGGGARGGAPAIPGMPSIPKEALNTDLHAPIIFLLGGDGDMAYPNGSDDFEQIEKLPAFLASMDVGHGGTYMQPHGGEFAKVAVAWCQWQLKGDKESGKMFTGDPCGLTKNEAWKEVKKKNIP